MTGVTNRALARVEVICSFERAVNIDLAITSTHGRTGLQHFVFGSFAERIIRNLSVPVLVNRERKNGGTFSEPTRVLVPFDFSDAEVPGISARRRAWGAQESNC